MASKIHDHRRSLEFYSPSHWNFNPPIFIFTRNATTSEKNVFISFNIGFSIVTHFCVAQINSTVAILAIFGVCRAQKRRAGVLTSIILDYLSLWWICGSLIKLFASPFDRKCVVVLRRISIKCHKKALTCQYSDELHSIVFSGSVVGVSEVDSFS